MGCAKVLHQQMPNSSFHQPNHLILAAAEDKAELDKKIRATQSY